MAAIVVPKKADEISAEIFGAPVATAVNLLTAPRVIAGVQANKTLSNLAAAVWSDVTGITLSFTAKANWLYQFVWQANLGSPSGAGAWMAAGLKVDGAAPARFVATGVAAPLAPGYGMAVNGSQYCSARMGGVLAAGSHTLVLQVTATGANYNVDGGAPCFIGVIDWGADT